MNVHQNPIRILCFGDSNTWGYIPGTGQRHPQNIRWTGLLQQSLGDTYEIIEEGLNSRTTVLEDSKHEGKNGATYLKPCLQSHYPLDLVVLMLGTNDLKERFNRTPEQIVQGVEELIKIINNPEYHYDVQPKILLISPPVVDESVSGVQEKYLGAEVKSRQLGDLYQVMAEKYSCNFIDSAKTVTSSKVDGYHLDQESHQKFAAVISNTIKKTRTKRISDHSKTF